MIRLAAGQRYGRLVAIRRTRTSAGKSMWLFQCDCGEKHTARGTHVRGGRISSCGCAWNKKHGMIRTPEYYTWQNMIQRCTNPTNPRFYCYGARGITVCSRWFSFENFIADVGGRPSAYFSIDRIDNNGNYEPDNVRWATSEQQLSTRRPRGPNRRHQSVTA